MPALPVAEAQQLVCPWRGFAQCVTRGCMAWRATDADRREGYCALVGQRPS
jgi:hypothetical protein